MRSRLRRCSSRGAAAHAVYVDRETGSGTVCNQANPCETIAEGIAAADEFVVVDDSPTPYNANLTLGSNVSLVAQDFVVPFSEGPTIIDGGPGTAVTVTGAAGVIRGFTLRGDQGVVANAPVTIVDNSFDDLDENGSGDVQVQASGSGVAVSGNTFTDPPTGVSDTAIALSSGSDATVVGNSFSGYDLAIDAAGDGTNPTIQANVVSGTEADGSLASGIFIHDDSSATLTVNTIESPAGGTRGIYVLENTATAAQGTGATLRRNQVLGHPTGVQVEDTTGPVSLEGNLIASSSATGLVLVDNGAPALDGADASATNVTFVGNSTDITSADAHRTLDSSIVEDPIAAAGGATCAIAFSRGPTTSGSDCQTFQTIAAPGFVNPGAGNFHLAPGSGMIDAGNPAAPAAPIDLEGDPRVLDGQCDGTAIRDIGADELDANCPAPSPPDAGPEPEPGDTAPPETVIDTGPSRKTRAKAATLTFHSTELGSSFECKLDDDSFEPCGSPRATGS